MYVIRFSSGTIRVRESRHFYTAEETGKPFAGTVQPTEEVIQEAVVQEKPVRERTPWFWV